MYFGLTLTTDYPCAEVDCKFKINDNGTFNPGDISVLGVFKEEVDLYLNSFISLRCCHNAKDFDSRKEELNFPVKNLYLVLSKFNSSHNDYVAINQIMDKAFRSVKFDVTDTEFKGKVNTGYKEIDAFVNRFVLVDWDGQKVYSPYMNVFFTNIDNDFKRLIAMAGNAALESDTFSIVDDDTYTADSKSIGFEELSKMDIFSDIMTKAINAIYKDEPLVVITKEDVQTTKLYNTSLRDHQNIVIIVASTNG